MNVVKSNENCCVQNCQSVRKKHPHLMYHGFPKPGALMSFKDEYGQVQKQDRRLLWITMLGIEKPVTKAMKVCSLHFAEDDYQKSGWSSVKRLKTDSLPTQNLPTTANCPVIINAYISRRSNEARDDNLQKDAQSFDIDGFHTSSSTSKSTENETYNGNDDDKNPRHSVQSILPNEAKSMPGSSVHDIRSSIASNNVSVQVKTKELMTVSDFITTEEQLIIMTGIRTFPLFGVLVKMIAKRFPENRARLLSARKMIFLTFMKLKLDLSYSLLSILFGVSPQLCKTIFVESVIYLASCLKPFIFLPSSDEIDMNTPSKYVEDYFLVLDCTEIPLQRQKKLCSRYSNYKSVPTAKFMSGITASGAISYVSSPYDGRVSDSSIFSQSGLIKKIQDVKIIVADRGFLIDKLCKQYEIQLNVPPCFHKQKHDSCKNVLTNEKIVSARVHIEHINRRLKMFKMLRSKFPENLIHIIGDVFIIACTITNLSDQILAKAVNS